MRADSLASIVSNYHTLQNTWDKAVTDVRDSETRISGVSAHMKKIRFYLATL